MKRIHTTKSIPNFSFSILTTEGKSLSNGERQHFYECLRRIDLRNKSFLFRGEQREKLSKIYGFPLGDLKADLFNKVFILGGKGRYFEAPEGHEGVRLGEYSRNQFYLIFEMVHKLLTGNYRGNKNFFMAAFKLREADLCNYFLDEMNADDFAGKMMILPVKEKIKARDYYLTLLHNIDKSEFYSQSFFLSTTTNLKRAEQFAGYRPSQANDNCIIFVGWLPPTSNLVLKAPTPNEFIRMINSLNTQLPIYSKLIFYNQNEIALKGGLLPHYMLGYQYWLDGQAYFEINPAIFQTDKNWNGEELPIDPGNFESLFKSTSFSRFFTLNERNGFYHDYGTDDYHFDCSKIC